MNVGESCVSGKVSYRHRKHRGKIRKGLRTHDLSLKVRDSPEGVKTSRQHREGWMSLKARLVRRALILASPKEVFHAPWQEEQESEHNC